MHSSKTGLCVGLLALAIHLPAQAQAPMASVVSVSSATPEEITAARHPFNSPSTPQGIYATPPTLTLAPHSAQAHPGSIWVRSSDDGLNIWGRVQANEEGFRWPAQKSEMLSSDHVEVWLATSSGVSMPAIGWGNQFGTIKLASLKNCADENDENGNIFNKKNCELWYGEQAQYRQSLQHLFARQWLVSGGLNPGVRFFEDFASSAYGELGANLFPDSMPTVLRPKSEDGFMAEIGTDVRVETSHDSAGNPYSRGHMTGYYFYFFIPYSAFPPTQQIKLTDLYLMVDVFSAAPDGHKMGDYSSSSALRQWGKPATFNHLRLAAPRTFSVTPCAADTSHSDLYGESYKGWFYPTLPGKEEYLRSTFALINPAGGYLYDPGGTSPEASEAKYFWKELPGGAVVCGPSLAWRKDATIKRSKFLIDEKHLEVKALPDGWSLLRSGPTESTHSAFGSGQCGSCPILGFDIFAVSPGGEISAALQIDQDLSGEGDQPGNAYLTVDRDWKRIILYREFDDDNVGDAKSNWTSTTYCLEGHGYKQCGESKAVTPLEAGEVLRLDPK
jgi:hypothetical protein